MTDLVEMLDTALGMAEQELELLAAKDTERLEILAQERARMVDRVLQALPAEGPSPSQNERLLRLKDLQEELLAAANSLQAETSQKLKELRQQGRCMSGYMQGTRTNAGLMPSRYISTRS